MAKYCFEFKKKLVLAYLKGEGSYKSLSKTYGVKHSSCLTKWVNNYQAFGDQGLKRSRKQRKYTFEEKLTVVECYLTSELSYQELAIQKGITNPCIIADWVNRYRRNGPEGLKSKKKGRHKAVGQPIRQEENKKMKVNKGIPEGISADYVKELEDELLKLRIENAFLKELRRLRLKEEAKMRKRRESYTVSEDPSN